MTEHVRLSTRANLAVSATLRSRQYNNPGEQPGAHHTSDIYRASRHIPTVKPSAQLQEEIIYKYIASPDAHITTERSCVAGPRHRHPGK